MRRPLFILTNILLPFLAVLAMVFVFWHWKGYPLPASLTTGRIGELVSGLKKHKEEKMLAEAEKLHRQNCLEELRFFKFQGTVFRCGNPDDGRWFIQFKNDGSIRVGLPAGATLRFKEPGQASPPVDLSVAFTEPASHERTTPSVLTIHSPYGARHFRLRPDYSIAEPALACRNLTFEEVGSDPLPPFRLEFAADPAEWKHLFPEEQQEEEETGEAAARPTFEDPPPATPVFPDAPVPGEFTR